MGFFFYSHLCRRSSLWCRGFALCLRETRRGDGLVRCIFKLPSSRRRKEKDGGGGEQQRNVRVFRLRG